ncbi:MAG TPA: Rieske (2Fe-2S) protein [Stenomitos sp.]
MGWTKVCTAATLTPGTREVVKVGKQKVLLLNQAGEIYAVDSRCPHMKVPMKNGKVLDNCRIVCPVHRSEFDLKSGSPTKWIPFPPGVGKVLGMISQEKQLPTFPTKVEDGSIWIDIAE